MNRNKNYLIVFVVTILTFIGCAVARSITYSNPPIIFAYDNSIPIIKDQSKVATIVTRRHGLSIAGIDLSKMRVSSVNNVKESFVVDVLPGTYTIEGRYIQERNQTLGNMVETTTTLSRFVETVELEAGHVYWVIIQRDGMLIEKDNLTKIQYFTDAAPDKNFPNYLKQKIIKSRNNAR